MNRRKQFFYPSGGADWPAIGQGAAFGPIASLLRGGGLYLNAASLGTLYQDSAGATPVTATSQPVGEWVSGPNGLLVKQATSGLRPTYTVTAGRATVVGDGSTTYLASTYLFGATNNCIIIDVDVPASLAAQQTVMGATSNANPVRFVIAFNTSGNLIAGVGNIAATTIKDSVDWRGRRCIAAISVDNDAGLVSLYSTNGLAFQTAIDGLPSTTISPAVLASSNNGAFALWAVGGLARLITAPKAITLAQFNAIASSFP